MVKREKKKKKKGGLVKFLLKVIMILILIIILLVLFAKFGVEGDLKDTVGGLPIIEDVVLLIDELDSNEEGINIIITEDKITLDGKEINKENILIEIVKSESENITINLLDDGAKHTVYQEVFEILKENGYIIIEKRIY